jgi:signal transduction histidine kinase/ActR/RegA family two-component response regulator/HAMP domain-containing protein
MLEFSASKWKYHEFLRVFDKNIGHKIIECSLISSGDYPEYIKTTDSNLTGDRVTDAGIIGLIKRAKSKPAYIWRKSVVDGRKNVLVAAPVIGPPGGTVLLSVSAEKPENQIAKLLLWLAGFAILMACMVFLLSFYESAKSLKHLKALTLMVEKFNRERNVKRIELRTNDEIGLLSDALNKMIENLNAASDELKRGREEAEAQSKFSDAVVQNIANGIVVVDPAGIITSINNAVESNMELTAVNIVGKLFKEVFPSWEGENTGGILEKVLKAGIPYTNERVRYKAPVMDRHTVFNIKIKPIVEKPGLILGAVVLLEFLTDKVLLEEHLLKVNEELQRANIVKSEFLSMVSHELRTPLTLIKMYSAMLAEKKIGPLTEKQEKAVNVLNRRCKNLNDLIDDLLDLSRVESGKMELNLEKVSLEELVSDAVGVYGHRAGAAGLVLLVDAKPELPPVLADRDKISRVINNLLENALKFTESGSITIKLDRHELSRNSALLSVSDTGIGIPQEYRERIFEKFFQVDGTDTREHGGSGLGLAIARELINLHGGKLWLDSSGEGIGSVFCFTLPIYKSGRALNKTPSGQYTVPSGVRGETVGDEPDARDGDTFVRSVKEPSILIVDDDVDFLEMMRDILMQDNYIVYTAAHGISALNELFSDKRIDIVLLDISMPKASGYEICKAIKMFDATKDIPVLMLTADGRLEQISLGYAAGASGYLVKPFRIEVLKRTIFRIMEGT